MKTLVFEGQVKISECWEIIEEELEIISPYNILTVYLSSGRYLIPKKYNYDKKSPIHCMAYVISRKYKDNSPVIRMKVEYQTNKAVWSIVDFEECNQKKRAFWYINKNNGTFDEQTKSFLNESHCMKFELHTNNGLVINFLMFLHWIDIASGFDRGKTELRMFFCDIPIAKKHVRVIKRINIISGQRAYKAEVLARKRAFRGGAPGLGKNS